MIDIHSHVLFDMDDGAATIEDSLAMVRMAAEHGTTDLVATPHADPQYRFDPELIAERLAQVQAASGGVLRLHTGCDFHLSFDNIQDALTHPAKYTINHGAYLLVEFSDLLIFRNTAEIFERLLGEGMIPIITHPERNGLLRQRIEPMEEWVGNGARVQITAQSLTGTFGRRAQQFCHTLLERGLVHVVASDGHDVERRPPVMDAAYELIAKTYGEPLAEAVCVRNPGAALVGEPMSLAAAAPAGGRKWYQIWR